MSFQRPHCPSQVKAGLYGERCWVSGVERSRQGAEGELLDDLNPEALETLGGAQVEPSLATGNAEATFQFERQGYFCRDPDSRRDRLVFNRTVALRDTWAKAQGGGKPGAPAKSK